MAIPVVDGQHKGQRSTYQDVADSDANDTSIDTVRLSLQTGLWIPGKGEEVKGTYSLEEDKQKSEMDRKIKEANLLKEKKRKRIKDLIKIFERIKAKNMKAGFRCFYWLRQP